MAETTLDGNPPAAPLTGAEISAAIQDGSDVSYTMNQVSNFLNAQNLGLLANRQTALANLGQGSDALIASASTSDIILTNPCPTKIIASFTAPGHVLRLPGMNTAQSLSTRGISSVEIFNDGAETYNIQYQDGTNIIPLASQQAILLWITDTSTPNGTVIPQPWVFSVNGITGQATIASDNLQVTDNLQTIKIDSWNKFNAYIASAATVNLNNPLETNITVDSTGFPNLGIILPDATALPTAQLNQTFILENIGSEIATLFANDGTTPVFNELYPGYLVIFTLTDISTANGIWNVNDVQQETRLNDTGTGSYSILPTDYKNLLYQRVFLLNNKDYTLPLISGTPSAFEFDVFNSTGNLVNLLTQGGDSIQGDTSIPPGCYAHVVLKKSGLSGNAYLSTIVYNLNIINKDQLSPFVVGTDAAKYTYTNFADAMAAAAPFVSSTFNPVILVTPGIYPDPWSWVEGVFVAYVGSLPCNGDSFPTTFQGTNAPVQITGAVTVNFAGSGALACNGVSFTNLHIQAATGYLGFQNCVLDSSNNQALQYDASSVFCTFRDCSRIGNAGFKQQDVTAGAIKYINCKTSDFPGSLASTVNNGLVVFEDGENYEPFEVGATGSVRVYGGIFGASTLEPINLTASGAFARAEMCMMSSNAGSGYWATGVAGGIILYAGVDTTFGNSHNINPVLQIDASDVSYQNIRLNNQIFNTGGQIWGVAFSQNNPSVMQSVAGNGIVLDYISPNFTISNLPATLSTPGQMTPNTCYVSNSGADIYQFPSTCAFGQLFEVICKVAGSQILTQGAQTIQHLGTVATISVTSTMNYSRILFRCTIANSEFTVVDGEGSFAYS